MTHITQFILAAVIFAVIDLVWISRIGNRFYRAQIGPLLLDKPNFLAALIFYLIFLSGLVVFAIQPAASDESALTALEKGALYGFVTYATYDLTNMATLKRWTWKMVAVDMIWGTFLAASTAGIVALILGYLDLR